MGQKTHPIGFRLGVSKTWRSQWYANRDFPSLLREDELLRKYLKARLGHAAIADIRIERKPGKVVVTIHTGRPGVVIGKKGSVGSWTRSSSPTTSPTSWRSASPSAAP
jgi:small subunit ribosomal protein S3